MSFTVVRESQEAKRLIRSILLSEVYLPIGMDTPEPEANSRIASFITDDVIGTREETSDGYITFTEEDVVIGFRRFLEKAAEGLPESE